MHLFTRVMTVKLEHFGGETGVGWGERACAPSVPFTLTEVQQASMGPALNNLGCVHTELGSLAGPPRSFISSRPHRVAFKDCMRLVHDPKLFIL